ncbi:hypothetical protein [Pseudoalteromonas sp. 2CM36K]|uniref:hypothetical protein n=1 Tax=Pseudoalteromonas sp. 2CM36K TaxID=2929854 RepID=UPI0020BD6EC0|nr:hypothetical protein [Pseudoalteromonas sp. 2CM36K]MCK8103008.1 hypothetical protein [Pseudoalteromonas sp. 2CM36K]
MSLISTYTSPSDLFMKLLREGTRTWRASDIANKSDHLFNFCVTSISLRDWCISYLKLTGKDKNDFSEMHSKILPLKYCGDIANSSKHFEVQSDRKSPVTGVIGNVETSIPMFADGKLRHDLAIETLSFEICTDDGKAKDLMLLLFEVCTEWIKVFKQFDIQHPNEDLIGHMFIEYQ